MEKRTDLEPSDLYADRRKRFALNARNAITRELKNDSPDVSIFFTTARVYFTEDELDDLLQKTGLKALMEARLEQILGNLKAADERTFSSELAQLDPERESKLSKQLRNVSWLRGIDISQGIARAGLSKAQAEFMLQKFMETAQDYFYETIQKVADIFPDVDLDELIRNTVQRHLLADELTTGEVEPIVNGFSTDCSEVITDCIRKLLDQNNVEKVVDICLDFNEAQGFEFTREEIAKLQPNVTNARREHREFSDGQAEAHRKGELIGSDLDDYDPYESFRKCEERARNCGFNVQIGPVAI